MPSEFGRCVGATLARFSCATAKDIQNEAEWLFHGIRNAAEITNGFSNGAWRIKWVLSPDMSSDLSRALSERLTVMSIDHKDKPQYGFAAEAQSLLNRWKFSSCTHLHFCSLYKAVEDKLKVSVIRAQMMKSNATSFSFSELSCSCSYAYCRLSVCVDIQMASYIITCAIHQGALCEMPNPTMQRSWLDLPFPGQWMKQKWCQQGFFDSLFDRTAKSYALKMQNNCILFAWHYACCLTQGYHS